MDMTAVLQLILNGLMSGAILAAPAIAFTAIYAVLRFPNFAIASHATIGAFAGYIANTALHLPAGPVRPRRIPGCRPVRTCQRRAACCGLCAATA